MRMFTPIGAAALMALSAASVFSAYAQSAPQQHQSAKKQPAAEPKGAPAAEARGRIVYHDRCDICHFSDSSAQKIGPGLKEIYKRGKFADGAKVDDASMERWILNGGKDMPPLKDVLQPAKIRDLIAYLRTI